jgi:probable HAF family extracellular repeat protein
MQGIGDLPGGAFESVAVDASADGSIVVGFGTTETGPEAFLWDAAAGMRNLRTLLADELGLDLGGWTLTEATGISDDGLTLVGSGINPDGVEQAWIAVIPEPATGILLAAGLAALASRHR